MRNCSATDLSYMMSLTIWTSKIYWTYFFSTTITIKGVTRYYPEINEELSIIDLSNNNFGGGIPQVIGELKGLHALDLSSNNLTGAIPSALANLRALESLDLSHNGLLGGIPQELTQLNFLAYFNVSYNRLAGPIPQANQFETFGSSSFEGNMGLCGIPLPNKCGNYFEASGEPLSSPEEEQEDHSGSPFQFGWKVVAIGYGCGFVVGVVYWACRDYKKIQVVCTTFRLKNLHVRRKRRTPEN